MNLTREIKVKISKNNRNESCWELDSLLNKRRVNLFGVTIRKMDCLGIDRPEREVLGGRYS